VGIVKNNAFACYVTFIVRKKNYSDILFVQRHFISKALMFPGFQWITMSSLRGHTGCLRDLWSVGTRNVVLLYL